MVGYLFTTFHSYCILAWQRFRSANSVINLPNMVQIPINKLVLFPPYVWLYEKIICNYIICHQNLYSVTRSIARKQLVGLTDLNYDWIWIVMDRRNNSYRDKKDGYLYYSNYIGLSLRFTHKIQTLVFINPIWTGLTVGLKPMLDFVRKHYYIFPKNVKVWIYCKL